MNLRPLHDRILVRRLEEQEAMRGVIIIPDSAKEKPQQAEVVAVGSGKLLEDGQRAAPDVQTGNRILFGKYSGSDITIEGILVRRLEEQEAMRGGIIIPDSAKEKPQQAEVVAVGSGKLLEDGQRAAPDSNH